jgi:hypothetical protein
MTSEQIAAFRSGTVEVWLQEIAYQLAVANEQKALEPVIAAEREFRALVARLPRLDSGTGPDGIGTADMS